MIRLGGSAPAVPFLSAISFWIRRWEEKDYKRAPSNPIDKVITFTYLSDEAVESKVVRKVTYMCIPKEEQHAGSNCCWGMYERGATPWWGRSCWATEERPNRSCVDTNTQTSCTHVPSECKPFLRPREQEAGALLTKKDRPVEFYFLSLYFFSNGWKLSDIIL